MNDPLEINLDDWIVVQKWERFQHYKRRKPSWIKVYTDLLDNPQYLALSMASRGLLQVIWCAFASENGRIRVKDVARFCHRSASIPQLESLYHAGFIDFSASTPLALSTEVEKEKESPSPLTSNGNGDLSDERILEIEAFNFAADWQGGTSDEFHKGLDTIERELHGKLSELRRMELRDLSIDRERKRVRNENDW
jgi:hypothetical protein